MTSLIESARKGPERYSSFIRSRFSSEKGHVVLNECALCGWLEWAMTRTNDPEGYSIEVMSVADCARCCAVQSRSPEVFDWISGVVSNLCRDIQKRLPDNGEETRG